MNVPSRAVIRKPGEGRPIAVVGPPLGRLDGEN